jgi:nucleoside-diphosphate-sugar epimerase
MRVLLTGHKGYIGSVLAPLLLENNFEVMGLDSDLYAGCDYGMSPIIIPEILKDIRDVEAADLEGIDAVLHLAALSNDPLGNLNPDLTFGINHVATVRLARLAKQNSIQRFVFSSSCSTYGSAGDDFVAEDAHFNPVTPYGASKVLADRDLRLLADDEFSPTLLRNATAYGLSPRMRFDLVINNLVAWAFTTGKILLKSDGTPWRPVVHVEDIAHAFIAVLQAPREIVHNQAFNIGRTAENYSIRELAEIVQKVLPECQLEFAPGAGPDSRSYRVDFGKVQRSLPTFHPQWDVRQGIEQLVSAYGEHGLEEGEFEGPRYRRVTRIQNLLNSGRLEPSLRWKSTKKVSAEA